MLAPQTRALLTDALRPPDGTRVDTAVATTFSLDLVTLLLAPMSFALHESPSTDLADVDPLALLESLQRHADRTTIFCQAGGIALPTAWSPLLHFLEDCVVEVTAPTPGRAFHPKVWVLRFADAAGRLTHRVLVLSRNLTFDRSWDTVLRLDEASVGTRAAAPDTTPLVDFVSRLPGLATAPTERQEQVADVTETLRTAHFLLPADVDDLRFLPLGLGADGQWPFPETASRALFISPFLSRRTVERARAIAPDTMFLSRPDAFDTVGATAFGSTATTWTLQRGAEVEAGEDATDSERVGWEGARVRDGLHAKTAIVESGAQATIVTGSANLTGAGFGGNVEFDVVMRGPRERCGIAALWDGERDATGLSALCVPYQPTVPEEADNALVEAEQRIDAFQIALAASVPVVELSPGQEVGTVDIALVVDADRAAADPGATFVWPASLRPVHGKPLDSAPRWTAVARRNVTPFVVVSTTVSTPAGPVTRVATLKAGLRGDPGNRREIALREIIRSPADVMRYLALLLADPSLDTEESLSGSGGGGGDAERWGANGGVAVLEPLLRAAARGDDALLRVHRALADLRALTAGEPLVPPVLDEVWGAVWNSRETP